MGITTSAQDDKKRSQTQQQHQHQQKKQNATFSILPLANRPSSSVHLSSVSHPAMPPPAPLALDNDCVIAMPSTASLDQKQQAPPLQPQPSLRRMADDLPGSFNPLPMSFLTSHAQQKRQHHSVEVLSSRYNAAAQKDQQARSPMPPTAHAPLKPMPMGRVLSQSAIPRPLYQAPHAKSLTLLHQPSLHSASSTATAASSKSLKSPSSSSSINAPAPAAHVEPPTVVADLAQPPQPPQHQQLPRMLTVNTASPAPDLSFPNSPFLSPEKPFSRPVFVDARCATASPRPPHSATEARSVTASPQPYRRLPKCNSCSTLFVNSMMTKSDLTETLRCFGMSVQDMVRATHLLGVFRSDEVFDEEQHPLSSSVRFSHPTKLPTADDITTYLTSLFDAAQLSAECAIISLVYIDRMLNNTNLTMHSSNWARIVLGGVLVASKVWDDQAVWNVDFCTVFPEAKLASMNELERFYIDAIRYNVFIKPSLYAQYYFALRDAYATSQFARLGSTDDDDDDDKDEMVAQELAPRRPLSIRHALKMEAITLTSQLRILEGPRSGTALGPLWSAMFPSITFLKGKYWNYRKFIPAEQPHGAQYRDASTSSAAPFQVYGAHAHMWKTTGSCVQVGPASLLDHGYYPHHAADGEQDLASSPRISGLDAVDEEVSDDARLPHDLTAMTLGDDAAVLLDVAPLPRKNSFQFGVGDSAGAPPAPAAGGSTYPLLSTYSLTSPSQHASSTATATLSRPATQSTLAMERHQPPHHRKLKRVVRVAVNTGVMRRSVSDHFYEPHSPAVIM